MNKIIVFIIVMLIVGIGKISAQTYMPERVGAKITYIDKNAKDKVLQGFRYEVTDVQKEDGKTIILFDIVVLDKKMKETGEVYKGRVWSAEGFFHSDVRYSLGSLAAVTNVDSIKGHPIILPENPTNGEQLEDCKITGPGIRLENSNIKVTTGESITTNAGTFDCFRVDSDDFAQVLFVKQNLVTKQWWKLGVGAVKYESYRKGKLQLNRELYSIE